MRLEICWRNLWDKRRSLIGWSLGLVVLVFLTMAFWPSIKGNAQYNELLNKMPKSVRAFIGTEPFSSPEGYLDSQLFLYVVPLLFMIYAIGRCADAIAGEEERKTMDLLLSTTVKRRQVVLQKYAAVVIGVVLLAVVVLVALWLSALGFSMNIGVDKLAAATSGSALLALLFAAVALAVSASTGRKGIAIAAGAVLATASFFLNSLGPVVGSLSSYQKLSPFHWYLGHRPLTNGFDLGGFGLLVAGMIVLLVVAVFGFDRRDVAV